MKIGISANMLKGGYDRYGDNMYRKLKEHGFSCIDFGMVDTTEPCYSFNENEFKDYFIKQKELATKDGIEFSQIHGPWRWPPQDATPEDREERMEKMKKSIKAASLLECRYWVVHPIMPYGIKDAGTNQALKTWELNISFMEKLLKEAKKYGVIICLENMPMPEFSIATPSCILNMVNAINDDNFQICLDTGHVSVFNDLSLSYAIRELGDKIKVLHIHDNNGVYDEHLSPYKGIIDWKEFSKALEDIGYNGVISLETLPDINLNDNDFDAECVKLCDIAKSIAY